MAVSGQRTAGSTSAAAAEVEQETEALEAARPFRWLIRAGFLARATTYGVIGALALALALGAGSAGVAPNQQGALVLIASGWLGRIAVVVIAAGLLAYALWKLTQGLFGRGPEGGGGTNLQDRVANLGGGAAYLVFFAVAIRVLAGSAGNSASEPRHVASGVLGWPGGPVLVGGIGVALIAISLQQLWTAFRGEFAKDCKLGEMGPSQRKALMLLGHIGLTARSIVFCVIGYFLLRTAIEFDPGSAVGVDGALARLHQQPLGPWLVGLVAVGLLTFAAFSVLEGRYRRL